MDFRTELSRLKGPESLFDRKMQLVANLAGPSNGYILVPFSIIVTYQINLVIIQINLVIFKINLVIIQIHLVIFETNSC